jgi:hypothetical protein
MEDDDDLDEAERSEITHTTSPAPTMGVAGTGAAVSTFPEVIPKTLDKDSFRHYLNNAKDGRDIVNILNRVDSRRSTKDGRGLTATRLIKVLHRYNLLGANDVFYKDPPARMKPKSWLNLAGKGGEQTELLKHIVTLKPESHVMVSLRGAMAECEGSFSDPGVAAAHKGETEGNTPANRYALAAHVYAWHRSCS